MAVKRWKFGLSSGLLQLAFIITLWNTRYEQDISDLYGFPEVQQDGQTALMNIVNEHQSPTYFSSKHTNEVDILLAELSRVTDTSRVVTRPQYLNAWLVTDVTPPADTSGNLLGASNQIEEEADLMKQDDVSEEDHNLFFGENSTHLLNDPQMVANSQFLDDEYNSGHISYSAENDEFDEAGVHESSSRVPFETQSSLELALQSLTPSDHSGLLLNMENDSYFPVNVADPAEYLLSVDADPSLLEVTANPTTLLDPSILDDLVELDDLDMDLMDINQNFDDIFPRTRKSISEDSAFSAGSSSPQSWLDRMSESSELLNLDEEGAVGYTDIKKEVIDQGFFEDHHLSMSDKEMKDFVSHDHTYGAPPGGIPHVRKMDLKVTKEPSRGFAHDEILCKKYKIPFSVDTIINSPVDEFNMLLKRHRLSSKQANLVKDIRRRGKNKMAAQNCRQKKIGELTDLEVELDQLRTHRDSLLEHKTVLMKRAEDVRKNMNSLTAQLLNELGYSNRQPSLTFTVEVGGNGELVITQTDNSLKKIKKGKRK